MRILITGASGSGTTTLGQALAAKLRWAFIDVDDYFWLPTKPPYQLRRDPSSRLDMILQELNRHDNAVASGTVMAWGVELENSFDLIVFLYLDTAIRIGRLRQRELEKLGFVDEAFIQWAFEYDTGPSEGRSLAKHQRWLSERTSPILRLEGDLTVDERCKCILNVLERNSMF